MVKSQAKTVVLLLSVRRPNNQVTPSSGSRMNVAFNIVLQGAYIVALQKCLHVTHAALLMDFSLLVSAIAWLLLRINTLTASTRNTVLICTMAVFHLSPIHLHS